MEERLNRPPKLFTVSEANALLPDVIPLVKELRDLRRSMIELAQELQAAVGKLAEGNGYPLTSVREEVERLTQRQLAAVQAFQRVLARLQELGLIIKDLDQGLVDFYHLRNGEAVWLCWKLGEDQVRFWHALEDGYAGRQPLGP